MAERDYPDTALQARQILALAQAISGTANQATPLVEEAVRAARELTLPRLLSTALLASADVRAAGGDARGALADAQAAAKMFAAAGQLESSRQACRISPNSRPIVSQIRSARTMSRIARRSWPGGVLPNVRL